MAGTNKVRGIKDRLTEWVRILGNTTSFLRLIRF
jgi:hypothetical protein